MTFWLTVLEFSFINQKFDVIQSIFRVHETKIDLFKRENSNYLFFFNFNEEES